METERKFSVIAKVVMNSNAAYSDAIGEGNMVTWEQASNEAKLGLINAIKGVVRDGIIDASGNHQNWVNSKTAAGWKYGPKHNANEKVSPYLQKFDALTPEQQLKDVMFLSLVWSMFNMLSNEEERLAAQNAQNARYAPPERQVEVRDINSDETQVMSEAEALNLIQQNVRELVATGEIDAAVELVSQIPPGQFKDDMQAIIETTDTPEPIVEETAVPEETRDADEKVNVDPEGEGEMEKDKPVNPEADKTEEEVNSEVDLKNQKGESIKGDEEVPSEMPKDEVTDQPEEKNATEEVHSETGQEISPSDKVEDRPEKKVAKKASKSPKKKTTSK